MNLQDKINEDIKRAMLDRNIKKLDALRAVKAAFIIEMAKDGSDSISDEIAQNIITRLVKQRRESAAIFSEKGRQDLAKDEIIQLEFLNDYLPDQLDEKEVRRLVKEIILEIGASSFSDMGRSMSVVMQRLKGKADGKLISELVKEILSS